MIIDYKVLRPLLKGYTFGYKIISLIFLIKVQKMSKKNI